MPDEKELEKAIENLKKQVSVLEQKLALYEKDPVKRGYFSLVNIVNQQINILNQFNLKDEIGSNPKEDKQYDRVKAIWEGLKEMIIDLRNLRIELKISEEDKEDETPFIESIAQQRK